MPLSSAIHLIEFFKQSSFFSAESLAAVETLDSLEAIRQWASHLDLAPFDKDRSDPDRGRDILLDLLFFQAFWVQRLGDVALLRSWCQWCWLHGSPDVLGVVQRDTKYILNKVDRPIERLREQSGMFLIDHQQDAFECACRLACALIRKDPASWVDIALFLAESPKEEKSKWSDLSFLTVLQKRLSYLTHMRRNAQDSFQPRLRPTYEDVIRAEHEMEEVLAQQDPAWFLVWTSHTYALAPLSIQAKEDTDDACQ